MYLPTTRLLMYANTATDAWRVGLGRDPLPREEHPSETSPVGVERGRRDLHPPTWHHPGR